MEQGRLQWSEACLFSRRILGVCSGPCCRAGRLLVCPWRYSSSSVFKSRGKPTLYQVSPTGVTEDVHVVLFSFHKPTLESGNSHSLRDVVWLVCGREGEAGWFSGSDGAFPWCGSPWLHGPVPTCRAGHLGSKAHCSSARESESRLKGPGVRGSENPVGLTGLKRDVSGALRSPPPVGGEGKGLSHPVAYVFPIDTPSPLLGGLCLHALIA